MFPYIKKNKSILSLLYDNKIKKSLYKKKQSKKYSLKNTLKFFNNYMYINRVLVNYYSSILKRKKAKILNNYKFNIFLILTRVKHYKNFTVSTFFDNLKFRFKRNKGNIFRSLMPTILTLNKMYYKKLINGYKIICNGRFSRRQRSSKKIFQKGRVSLSTLNAKIEYVYKSVVLRNSLCGFKLYVQYSH